MSTRVLAAAALPGLLLAFCSAASAAEPAREITEVDYNGVKVGIDSETGKLRPLTAVESAALDRVIRKRQPLTAASLRAGFSRPANAVAARATARRIIGGGTSVKLPESEMSQLIATRDAAGNLTIEHAESGAAAQASGNQEQGL